jgi:hypothetical protein
MSLGNLMNIEVMAAFSSYVSTYHPHLVGMLEQILENPQRK